MKRDENKIYKTVMAKVLEERCQNNPRYSLRAFARDTGLSPARVSEILSGKQGLSKARALEVAKRLGLSGTECIEFADSVEANHARSALLRRAAEKRLEQKPKNPLSDESFNVVADWYHFGILELCELADFKWDIKRIAKELGIQVELVKAATERLKNLGLLVETKQGFKPAEADTFSSDGVPSEALRRFHRQNLEKATAALSTQTVEERDYLTAYMAFDKDQLPEVKKVIREAYKKISALKGPKSKRKNVYSLCVQFFKITESQEV